MGVGGVSWKAGAAGVTDGQHRLHCLIFIWLASGLVITGGGEEGGCRFGEISVEGET